MKKIKKNIVHSTDDDFKRKLSIQKSLDSFDDLVSQVLKEVDEPECELEQKLNPNKKPSKHNVQFDLPPDAACDQTVLDKHDSNEFFQRRPAKDSNYNSQHDLSGIKTDKSHKTFDDLSLSKPQEGRDPRNHFSDDVTVNNIRTIKNNAFNQSQLRRKDSMDTLQSSDDDFTSSQFSRNDLNSHIKKQGDRLEAHDSHWIEGSQIRKSDSFMQTDKKQSTTQKERVQALFQKKDYSTPDFASSSHVESVSLNPITVQEDYKKNTTKALQEKLIEEREVEINRDNRLLPLEIPADKLTQTSYSDSIGDKKNTERKKKKGWFTFGKKKNDYAKTRNEKDSPKSSVMDEFTSHQDVFPLPCTELTSSPSKKVYDPDKMERIKFLESSNLSMKKQVDALKTELNHFREIDDTQRNTSSATTPTILPVPLESLPLSDRSRLLIEVQQQAMEKLISKNQRLQNLVACQPETGAVDVRESRDSEIAQLREELRLAQALVLEKQKNLHDLTMEYDLRHKLITSLEDKVQQLEKKLQNEERRSVESREKCNEEIRRYATFSGKLVSKMVALQNQLFKERKGHLSDTYSYAEKLRALKRDCSCRLPVVDPCQQLVAANPICAHRTLPYPDPRKSVETSIASHYNHANNQHKKDVQEVSYRDPNRTFKESLHFLDAHHTLEGGITSDVSKHKILALLNDTPICVQKEKNGFYVCEERKNCINPSVYFTAPSELVEWAIGSSKKFSKESPSATQRIAAHQFRQSPRRLATTNMFNDISSETYREECDLL